MPRRGLILGGEAPAAEWLESIQAAAPRCAIFNHYGPTETTVGVVTYRIPRVPLDPELPAPPIGRPLAETAVHLLDGALTPVSAAACGEIHVAGAGVSRGYLRCPALTAERFLPNPFGGEVGDRLYRTGDLARALDGGELAFAGRTDDQVKIRGFRVELGEIEATLRRHPGIREAVVLPWRQNGDSSRLVAYVVGRAPAMDSHIRSYRLPNDLEVAHLNRNETDYIYAEIFERRAYVRHGIALDDGAVIFDVGSNIGLFTLFAHHVCQHPRVYAFEPVPAVYSVLEANAARYGLDAKLFDHGLSDGEKTADFTYFPGFSLLSGRYADAERERDMVKRFMANQDDGSAMELLLEEADELLAARLQGEPIRVRLRTLSAVIEEQAIERIDLLKINAEKSELDVLRGIRERDWDKIRQIVLEVDTGENLGAIRSLIGEHGFEHVVDQDTLLAGTELCYVYALRRSRASQPAHRQNAAAQRLAPTARALSAGELRRYLRHQLPQYMVPEAVVPLDALPVTANGKLDREALPDPTNALRLTAPAAPRTDLERTLAGIWSEVLGHDRVGVDANFFDVGGNSLLMAQVALRVRSELADGLSAVKLFEHPTISALAEYLESGQAQPPAAGEGRQRAAARRRARSHRRRRRAR